MLLPLRCSQQSLLGGFTCLSRHGQFRMQSVVHRLSELQIFSCLISRNRQMSLSGLQTAKTLLRCRQFPLGTLSGLPLGFELCLSDGKPIRARCRSRGIWTGDTDCRYFTILHEASGRTIAGGMLWQQCPINAGITTKSLSARRVSEETERLSSPVFGVVKEGGHDFSGRSVRNA